MANEAKFTPGPWSLIRNEEDGEGWRVYGTTPSGIEGCYCIADVIDSNGGPINKANATAIIALPDLFSALRGLLEIEDERIASGLFTPNAEGMKRIEAAREAIRKATEA